MSNRATFPHAKQLREVFETLRSDQLQALIASGLLSDLQRCAAELDPAKVDRNKFRRILGLDPSVFIVTMGGPENTDQITATLGFPFSELITQVNFPLRSNESTTNEEIELIDPGCLFSEEEGLKFLSDAKLDRPTYEHAIRFAEQYRESTISERKSDVIFLHEPWRGQDRNRRVVCLDRRASYRKLRLRYCGSKFHDHCVLAGVRHHK